MDKYVLYDKKKKKLYVSEEDVQNKMYYLELVPDKKDKIRIWL